MPTSGALSYITSTGQQDPQYLSETDVEGDEAVIEHVGFSEVWTLGSNGQLTSTFDRVLATDGTYVDSFGPLATLPSTFSVYTCTANSASTQGQVILDCSATPTSAQGNFNSFVLCDGYLAADGSNCDTVDDTFSQLTLSTPPM